MLQYNCWYIHHSSSHQHKTAHNLRYNQIRNLRNRRCKSRCKLCHILRNQNNRYNRSKCHCKQNYTTQNSYSRSLLLHTAPDFHEP